MFDGEKYDGGFILEIKMAKLNQNQNSKQLD